MLPNRVLYYGKDESLAEQIPLRAGPLTMVYEDGDLRYVKLGDREILRRVYVAIRDRNWGTVLPVLSNVQVEQSEDSFRICYDVQNKEGDIDFRWKGTIEGDPTGTIRFNMDGVAHSTFWRNRIGFCVLHPMRECADQPCVAEKADGTREEGRFPEYISPHEPFMGMQAFSHQVLPDLWARVQFSGDIFEMEDQRNWTDASFKTYCTPLALPFPVEVKEGTNVSQSITLTLEGQLPESASSAESESLTFGVGDGSVGELPQIGLAVASHGQPLSERELDRLKNLHLSHLRVDLKLAEAGYETALQQAAGQARALGVPLEIAVYVSDAAKQELGQLVAVWKRLRPRVCRWLVFHTQEISTSKKWMELARPLLAGCDPQAKIGAGTDYFFTELNRERPPVDVLDVVNYSLNPQVHAFDNASLVETLEAQASTAESARQFSGGLPLTVSAITFKMRSNPNATGPAPEPEPGELPSRVDERQMSLFGAGWTLGSMKYIAESAASSVTYFETSGWLGVMETEAGSALADKFQSIPGSVFPMYHVFADLGEFAGGRVIPSQSSATLAVDGLALTKDGKTRVLIASFSPERQQLRVENVGPDPRIFRLNETNAEKAMENPEAFRSMPLEQVNPTGDCLDLELLPYEIVSIDWEA